MLSVLVHNLLRECVGDYVSERASDVIGMCIEYIKDMTVIMNIDWKQNSLVSVQWNVAEWTINNQNWYSSVHNQVRVYEGIHQWTLLLEKVEESAFGKTTMGLRIGIMQSGWNSVFYCFNPKNGRISTAQKPDDWEIVCAPIQLKAGNVMVITLDLNLKLLKFSIEDKLSAEMTIVADTDDLEYYLCARHNCIGNRIRMLSYKEMSD